MAYTQEDTALALAFTSVVFWTTCALFHSFVLIVHAKLGTIQISGCDSALIRFVKTSCVSFHYNSLLADLLRAGAAFILLKAINDRNINMLVNFLRYKYIEVFLLLISLIANCCKRDGRAFLKAYYTISLVLDIALLYVIFNYCCVLLNNK
ncbi:uncharacterized protein LOC101456603 [Ceratitis capitata]|uniref:uncharacterized protein LOC101456603 n=1 Tax=Ceratitis capitata TaxID=7213 RepID=UPI00032A077A|nr:uncharacterized protein LOC101456603 [Ceratitis capitata]XP_012155485.1 uncharacterized protein LOC101456603 [Ceratitis capitata]XP_020713145.1 uncharacterized protein LOC101456603 [Ceratitis capitata]XP_020713146.1 uncharacterized protein LOC101456603 [Ceratitis capitata]